MQILPLWVDLVAIAAGALFGATAAVRHKAPLVGIFLAGVLAALGGGILRDVLLGAEIAAMRNPYYLPTALVAIILALPLYRVLPKTAAVHTAIDAFSLGAFVVVGTEKALSHGLGATQAIVVGIATAVGGGVMNDVLMGKGPIVMARGRWYVTAVAIGAMFFAVLHPFVPAEPLRLVTVALVVALRELSERLEWDAPTGDRITRRKRS